MRIFAVLFAGLLATSLLTMGCSKSNPASVVIHDTLTLHQHDTLTHRDTVTVKTGPAFIRFLAFLNSSQTITLKKQEGSSFIPFASAASQSSRQYLPIRGDTVLNLFGSFFDNSVLENAPPFKIPAVGSGTLVSVILFEVPGPSLFQIFKSDPLDPPPAGYGYLRLIDGCSDFPTPHPKVEAYLDALSNPALLADPDTHAPKYLTYEDASEYVLVPSGPHTLLLKGEMGSTPDYTTPLNVTDGGYYTARLVGLRTAGTDRVIVDVE
jgi:hypothetical protein